jgi:cobalamin biosynthesis Mg chelatase CobN
VTAIRVKLANPGTCPSSSRPHVDATLDATRGGPVSRLGSSESKPDEDELDAGWDGEEDADSGSDDDDAVDAGWDEELAAPGPPGTPRRAPTAEEREAQAARAAARKDRRRGKASEKSERRKARADAAAAKQKKQKKKSGARTTTAPRDAATDRRPRRRVEGRAAAEPGAQGDVTPGPRATPARAPRRAVPLVVVVVLLLFAAAGVIGLFIARR